jgi:antitoxin component YwqK of YwqJK toxin-antitoxin module
MKFLLTLFCISLQLIAATQTREEIFDFQFQPAKSGGYYYVVTEKKDSLWKRQAWFLSQKTRYMEGWYKDDSCKIGHGEFKWYHPNGYLRTKVNYVDGFREGVFLSYDEQGRLKDSLNYVRGHRIGVGYSWHDNGYVADSTNFDGKGNGIEVRWFDDGLPSAAGYWIQDSLKKGRWKYFHHNGSLMAVEDYDANGKLLRCDCYDEKGVQLDTALCREKEASVDAKAWKRFLEKNLTPLVEQKAREGIRGNFTVVIRFVVDKDGSITEIEPLTSYGHGIEEGVVKIFNKAPSWIPGRLYGKYVKSYHTQPVSFVISSE